jgi:response regulator RpfG family c-di-GMP phosphodiesterase
METRPGATSKILVVDDERHIRDVLCEVARRGLNLQAIAAGDADEALERFLKFRPDVVITDIQMPGMDGVSLLKRIKDEDPTVPVVLITGYPSLDVAIRGMKEGATDFLTKPFQLKQVKVVIEKALRERRILIENKGLRKEMERKRALEQLNEQLNRKLKEVSALYEFGERIGVFPIHQHTIIRSMLQIAREVTLATEMSFLVPDGEGGGRFRIIAHLADGVEISQGLVHLETGSLTHRCMKSKAPLLERIPDHGSPGPLCGTLIYPKPGSSQLAVPCLIKGEVFGILYAIGRCNGEPFDDQDITFLVDLTRRASLGLENKYLYDSVFDVLMSTLRSLVSTIEARDPYTRQHSQRVTDFSVLIAEALGCSPEEVDTVRVGGYLHDLGKLGVKDSILLKSDDLTEEEFEQIKAHPVIGEAIIAPLGFLPDERALIRHHHERWDGKGYPDGLSGEDIPYLARILTVADSFDAMTSDRPYRRGMNFKEGYREIIRCRGTQFDPDVVDAFREVFPLWMKRCRSNERQKGKTPAVEENEKGLLGPPLFPVS